MKHLCPCPECRAARKLPFKQRFEIAESSDPNDLGDRILCMDGVILSRITREDAIDLVRQINRAFGFTPYR